MYKSSGIRIEELLNLDIMKDSKVLAGSGGLGNLITKVNVMEVPDILNWVEEGEFLLTTAYSMKDNLEGFKDLIIHFRQKGLAGMGIKTKRYINEIPESIINVANELEFPLIDISFELSFSTIITRVLTEIVNNQTNILAKIGCMHNKLIDIMLGNGGLKEIAKALYDSLEGKSLAIHDYVFGNNIIMCKKEYRTFIENIIEIESNNLKSITKDSIDKTMSRTTTADYFGEMQIERINIPIKTNDKNYGCIYIWQNERALNSVEITVIEAAIPIVALDIYKKILSYEIDSRYRIEFIENLLSNDDKKYKRALEMSSYFNFDNSLKYSVGIISLTNLYQMEQRIISIVKKINENIYPKIIIGNKSNKIIILYGVEKEKNDSKVKEDIKIICDEILRYSKYENIKNIAIGIGSIISDSRELYRSYNEANRTIEYLNNHKHKKFAFFDELGIFRILSSEEIRPDLKQIYLDLLGNLLKYDTEKGTEFIETLTSYFKHSGNLKKVSEEMFSHYNTIIYRIQRIKEITGINFDDYDEILNLQIALKIHELMKHNE
ncbi:MAG: PucR family transcriptional regulator [Sedimentibacter sp.]